MAATIPEGNPIELYDELGRRRSDPSSPTHLHQNFDPGATARTQLISPPQTPRAEGSSPTPQHLPPATRPRTRPEKISIRLRSNSGLSMHTNEIALRQYTDYNPDGSPRSPLFGSPWRPEWISSIDQVSAGSRATNGNGSSSSLHIPDFLSREVFQMSLNNPTTCHRLLKYAYTQGCGESVEFLLKLQEYSRSLEAVTSLLGQISTSYTSYAATSPLNLPSLLTKSLNTDVKNVTTTVLPGLEILFLEARCFIEQKVYREIYPGFVRHQLGLSTQLSLASTPSVSSMYSSVSSPESYARSSEFPGLGDAFCITDSLIGDNRITHASDGFVNVTGYTRQEIMRNCRFLQGPQTDREVVSRLRDAISRKEESVELLLNYRKDGQPFWNLLYVTPLFDGHGNARFFLGGQINVSDTVSSNKDILRVLNAGATAAGEMVTPLPVDIDDETDSKHMRLERGASTRSGQGPSTNGASKTSAKSRFFNPFSRKSPAAPSSGQLSPPPTAISVSSKEERRRSYHEITSGQNRFSSPPPAPGLESFLMQRSLNGNLGLPNRVDNFYSAYSSFMMLEYIPPPDSPSMLSFTSGGSSRGRGGSGADGPSPPRGLKKGSGGGSGIPQFLVSFASRSAVELLGLQSATIERQEIFGVLEQASSGGLGKTFRNTVRERLRDGAAVSLDFIASRVDNAPYPRKGSIIERMYLEEPPKKQIERMVSYWTPLKDEVGRIGWVVLVVTPTQVS